jgi:transportin-3
MDFLPTLHTFLKTTGPKLVQDDRRQVYEAIAYVISAMPINQSAESLKTFCVDILAQVHDFATRTTVPTTTEIHSVGGEYVNMVLVFLAQQCDNKMVSRVWKPCCL